ncbi:DUF4118 domain-containing protein [Actinoplanes sp. NPDC000266]
MRTWLTRTRLAVGLAIVVPFGVAAALVPFRGDVQNTQVALLLVVAVVGVAAFGSRPAGYLAAASAGVWFNFFYAPPYLQLDISGRSDVRTFFLLLAVGVAVTELAVWGRRQASAATREAAYLEGIHAAARASAAGGPAQAVIEQVAAELAGTLHLREARYEPGVAGAGQPARLRHDGQIVWRGKRIDVAHDGLPPETELLVESAGQVHGRYMLRATAHTPASMDELRVAVTLADQVAAALRRPPSPRPGERDETPSPGR